MKQATLNKISVIASMAAIVCFFMTFFSVSAFGMTIKAIGLNLAVGLDAGVKVFDGNPLFFLLILIPLLEVFVNLIMNKPAGHIISALFSIGCIISILQFRSIFFKQLGYGSDFVETGIGFWGYLIASFIVVITCIVMVVMPETIDDKITKPILNKNTQNNNSILNVKKFCGECGNPLSKDDTFCSECGCKINN